MAARGRFAAGRWIVHLLIAPGGGYSHEYDYCMDSVDGEEAVLAVQAPKLLRQLFHGISVAVLGMSLEGEKVGRFSGLLVGILTALQKLLDEQARGPARRHVSLSYGLFAVSDSSCIDLLTYSRKDIEEIEPLVREWCPLTETQDVDQIIGSIRQGYSLPCVALVRLFVRGSEEGLPGAMSTLLLADLGPLSNGSSGSGGPALEKSFALLKSHILTLDQPFISSSSTADSNLVPRPSPTFLATFLERCFGGDMATLVVADLPRLGNARSMLGFAQLLDCIRRIKNRPTCQLETPEMLELNLLVETHGKLEVEHRAIRRELRQLQKALRVTERQRESLLSEQALACSDREVERLDYQYELARIAMEKVQIHERIRQCEIDLVCMEHERLLLLAEMGNKQRQLAELEERLCSSVQERDKIKEEYSREVKGLAARLESASKQLETAEQERMRLQGSLDGATSRIGDLQRQIGAVERAKSEIETCLEQKSAASSQQLEAKLADLAKLRLELDRARENEAQLQRRLGSLESTADAYKTSVGELEARLAAMKVENVALHAKLEVLSMKPQSPEVSRTIRVMEDKWLAERQAMHSVMDELRQMIKDKNGATSPLLLPTDHHSTTTGPASKKSRLSSVFTEADRPSQRRGRAGQHEKDDDDEGDRNVGARQTPRRERRKSVTFANIPGGPELAAQGGALTPQSGSRRSRRNSLSNTSGGGVSMGARKTANPTPEPSSTTHKRAGSKVLAPPPSSSQRRGKGTNLVSLSSGNSGAPIASIVERIKDGAGTAPAVKLSKTSRGAEVVSGRGVQTVDKALSKLLDEEVDRGGPHEGVVIPGTPPKGNAPSIAPNSPAKTWKPSAFIPALARKPTGAGAGEPIVSTMAAAAAPRPAMSNVFAGLSFAAGGSADEGFRKRIKLPDRAKPSLAFTSSAPGAMGVEQVGDAPLRRNNLDSSIMSTFNIPAAGGGRSDGK